MPKGCAKITKCTYKKSVYQKRAQISSVRAYSVAARAAQGPSAKKFDRSRHCILVQPYHGREMGCRSVLSLGVQRNCTATGEGSPGLRAYVDLCTLYIRNCASSLLREGSGNRGNPPTYAPATLVRRLPDLPHLLLRP